MQRSGSTSIEVLFFFSSNIAMTRTDYKGFIIEINADSAGIQYTVFRQDESVFLEDEYGEWESEEECLDAAKDAIDEELNS